MSEKKADKPYMPFYIGDWKKAPEIRALRLDYRMVWFETLLIMWQGDEKGYLTINSIPFVITDAITGVITDGEDVLASMLGISVEFLQETFKMLKKLNVYEVRNDGAVYSRFMVNMLKTKAKKSKSGVLGMEKRYGKSVITPAITNCDNENGNNINTLNWGKESGNFLKDKIWIEQFCMQKGLQKKELEKSMKHFVTTMTLQEDWKTCVELKRHYTNYFNRHGLNGSLKITTDTSELESKRIDQNEYMQS